MNDPLRREDVPHPQLRLAPRADHTRVAVDRLDRDRPPLLSLRMTPAETKADPDVAARDGKNHAAGRARREPDTKADSGGDGRSITRQGPVENTIERLDRAAVAAPDPANIIS